MLFIRSRIEIVLRVLPDKGLPEIIDYYQVATKL